MSGFASRTAARAAVVKPLRVLIAAVSAIPYLIGLVLGLVWFLACVVGVAFMEGIEAGGSRARDKVAASPSDAGS